VYTGVAIDPAEIVLDAPKSPLPSGDFVTHHKQQTGAGSDGRVVVTGQDVEALSCFACGGSLDLQTAQGGNVRCAYCSTLNNLTTPTCACPGCGTRVSLSAGDAVGAYMCPSCGGSVGTTQAEPALLERGAENFIGGQIKPPIALGKTGTLRGSKYVVTGHMRLKTQDSWGVYISDELMVYNAKHGFRWLTLDDGHWSLVSELTEPPPDMSRLHKARSTGPGGKGYRFFEADTETIIHVAGQLPYVASAGDKIAYADWIAPPLKLTEERTASEVEYFISEYVEPSEVAEAFGVDAQDFPPKIGIGPHEPKGVKPSTWGVAVVAGICLCLNMFLFVYSMGAGSVVHKENLDATDYAEEFLTESFQIRDAGLTSVEVYAGLNNQWAALDGAFVDEEGNVVTDFSVAWEYYHGVEGGESWSEGSKSSQGLVRIPKAGSYQLLLKGEAAAPIKFSVAVREGAVLSRYFLMLCLLFAFVVGVIILQHTSIERRRWNEDDDD